MGGYDDTVESINSSIRFIKRINAPLKSIMTATPYPGAPFYDRILREGGITTFD